MGGTRFTPLHCRAVTRTDLNGKRVAIVMMSAIGDVVHVLPVVNSLRAAAPGMHLTWVIQPGPYQLVKDHPAVDEFILFDRKQGWRAFRDLWRATRGKRFDLVFALQVYFKAGVITGMLKAKRKLGFDRLRARDANWLFTTERIPARGYQHVQDQYFEFLEHVGIEPRLEWRLGSTADEEVRYEGLLPPDERPTVALVLGTSNPQKDWPAERYTELVDRLEGELGVRTVLVGAPSERERAAADHVFANARHTPLDLLAWDLRRLVYLLERSDVLVTPDTGPLHIGIALGTPTVSLLGYSNPKWCGPYRRFSELMIDEFGDPGENYPGGRIFRPGRMERITVEQVFERVRLALERYPRAAARGQSAP